jgi:hypothetical protein
MRIALALPLVLVLGACQVSKDNANNTVSVTYNEEVASNTAAKVGNTAENIANDIGTDVKKTGEKIDNKIGNADVNVKANKDIHTNTTEKKK